MSHTGIYQANRPTALRTPARRPQNPRIPPESVAFFGSVNATSVMGRNLPQPVVARNSGIMQAWHAWSQRQEGTADKGVMAELIATTRRSFEQNLATLLHHARMDPIWQLNAPTGPSSAEQDEATLVLPTASLMFWSRQHAVIESTDALEQLLLHSDIGADLPASLLRPPIPAIFIRFGKLYQDAVPLVPINHQIGDIPRLQGVYVFHSERERNRTVSIVPVFEFSIGQNFCANSVELVINDETRSLNENIAELCKATGQGEYFISIVQMVAKILFYMEQSHVVQIQDMCYTLASERMKGLGAKKVARIVRHMADLYDRVVLGPHETVRLHAGEISPHLRRGHFRMQPYGPESSLRKVIFVAPTWIRSDRLAPARSS
jgi:hypothetical protein